MEQSCHGIRGLLINHWHIKDLARPFHPSHFKLPQKAAGGLESIPSRSSTHPLNGQGWGAGRVAARVWVAKAEAVVSLP